MAQCDISVIQNALGIQQTGPRTVIVPADPIIWSEDTSYEYLTLVASTDFGKSYISKRNVPAGTPLTNTNYWIPAADYNAQMAQIQQDLDSLETSVDSEISTLQTKVDSMSAASRENVFAVFSDSTFQRNPDPATSEMVTSVVEFMQQLMPAATVKNYGRGGTGTNYLVEKLNSLSVDTSVDTVLIAYGTNDWQASFESAPILASQSGTTNTELNAERAIARAKVVFPNAHIIWFTPAHIHSPAASAHLNVNSAGSTPYAYYDTINKVCVQQGVQCVRLDKIMGVDESNYQNYMVTSGGGIFVHYNEGMTKRIAEMIANDLYSVEASPSVPAINYVINRPAYASANTLFGHWYMRNIVSQLPAGSFTLHAYAYGSGNVTIGGETYPVDKSTYLTLDFDTESAGKIIITSTVNLFNVAVMPRGANYFGVPQKNYIVWEDAENDLHFVYDGLVGIMYGESANIPTSGTFEGFPLNGSFIGFCDTNFTPVYGRVGNEEIAFSQAVTGKYLQLWFGIR